MSEIRGAADLDTSRRMSMSSALPEEASIKPDQTWFSFAIISLSSNPAMLRSRRADSRLARLPWKAANAALDMEHTQTTERERAQPASHMYIHLIEVRRRPGVADPHTDTDSRTRDLSHVF